MKPFSWAKHIKILLLCLVACIHSYAGTTRLAPNTLINYVSLGQFNKDQAKIALSKIPPLDTLKVHYILNLYQINYRTPAPDGSITIASGLVAMPDKPKKAVAVVSYQHGTRVMRDDVPSRNNERNHIYLATFGSNGGYMTVMPDYLGQGDNELMLHPYVQADTLASSSIDMLIAAKELAKMINYPITDSLYLAGYSEGGFSTMVMFEELEKNYQDQPVTAAAPGSAPYDWTETMDFILLQPGPRATAYSAFFFYSMQTYKNYWQGLDEIFVQPFDTLIPLLFDGTHQMPEILQRLPKEPKQIFQSKFYASILNETDKNIDVLKKNINHYYFTPKAPLLLVGAKGDKDVPYHASEMAWKILHGKSDKVYLKNVGDTLDHIQALPFVMKEQLDFFKQYDEPES